TVPVATESTTQSGGIFANPPNQFRVIILQPVNRGGAASFDVIGDLNRVRWCARHDNGVARPNELVDVICERAFDCCIFDKGLGKIAAASLIMFEMQNRH